MARNKRVHITFTSEELKIIDYNAKKLSITRSDYIRICVLREWPPSIRIDRNIIQEIEKRKPAGVSLKIFQEVLDLLLDRLEIQPYVTQIQLKKEIEGTRLKDIMSLRSTESLVPNLKELEKSNLIEIERLYSNERENSGLNMTEISRSTLNRIFKALTEKVEGGFPPLLVESEPGEYKLNPYIREKMIKRAWEASYPTGK